MDTPYIVKNGENTNSAYWVQKCEQCHLLPINISKTSFYGHPVGM